MPDLLLELFSEEIPARMQAKAADDLRRMVTDKLVAEGLVYEGAKAFATPRRLALTVHGIPARQADLKEERKGPRVGGPDAAIAGFLKATGLSSIGEAQIQRDPKKGDFYVALMEKEGRPAIDVLAEIIPTVIMSFPWPKSMRWGAAEDWKEESFLVTESGQRITTEDGRQLVVETWLRWVRPLHSIVATFGLETEEPEIVPFAIGQIRASNITFGHRFMAPEAFTVRRFGDYEAKLNKAKVVLDPERRRDMIVTDARQLAFAQGFELFEDTVLLDEVAGLVEFPTVLMGDFDQEFLALPGEIIRSTIRNNQKCFVVRNAETGFLVPRFILVANIEATDGGRAIIAGNERVIRARLSDAKFFYEADLKTKLEDRLDKFEAILFHEKLGTQAERVVRIEELAATLASIVGADLTKTRRAAKLAKADLLTEVVGEFPELQGLMGRHYAQKQGEDGEIAFAIEQHYQPKGPDDFVPQLPVSIAVALADKIDTLVGFWAIDEKPTGSKDPYALRRAALGVIRIILDRGLRINLARVFYTAAVAVRIQEIMREVSAIGGSASVSFSRDAFLIGGFQVLSCNLLEALSRSPDAEENRRRLSDLSLGVLIGQLFEQEAPNGELYYSSAIENSIGIKPYTFLADLLSFFADRLKVQLREQGARHDLVDAVFALGNQDDLLMIVRRVEALGDFLDTDDGKNLLAGTKRASNILAIEEKKDKRSYEGDPIVNRMTPIERHLWNTIQQTLVDARHHVDHEDFVSAMEALSTLRSAVDSFFSKEADIRVNHPDPAIRENRLKLLNQIRAATRAVADFSKIEG